MNQDVVRVVLVVAATIVIVVGALTEDVGVVSIGLGLLGVPGFSTLLTGRRATADEGSTSP